MTKAEKQVERWNERYPAGSEVTYHSASKQLATKTKGEAFVLSGHTACIFVEGIRGCVAVSALIPNYDTAALTPKGPTP